MVKESRSYHEKKKQSRKKTKGKEKKRCFKINLI